MPDIIKFQGYRIRDSVATQNISKLQEQTSDLTERMIKVEGVTEELSASDTVRVGQIVESLIDPTLERKGKPADAYFTGKAIEKVKYTLPIASDETLGGVKIGAGLGIASDGTVYATGSGGVADSIEWEKIIAKPSTFPPAEHTHTLEEIGAAAENHTHTARDIGAMPDTYEAPVKSVNGETGDIVIRQSYAVNLLDNSNFLNPVNQRSTSGAKGVSYIFDRWFMTNTSDEAIVDANGLTLTYSASQKVQLKNIVDPSEMVTIAVCDSNNVIDVKSGVLSEGVEGIKCAIVIEDETEGIYAFSIISGGTYKWAALYAGEFTAETLPPYVAPSYVEELSKCRRYYRWYGATTFSGWVNGLGTTITVDCPCDDMRIVPTVSAVINSGKALKGSNGYNISADKLSLAGMSSNNRELQFTYDYETGVYKSCPAAVRVTSIEFNAEL